MLTHQTKQNELKFKKEWDELLRLHFYIDYKWNTPLPDDSKYIPDLHDPSIRKWYNRGYRGEPYLHRDKGPAVVTSQYEEYFLYGARHNSDGPASIFYGERIEFYTSGVLNRKDGPAKISKDAMIWYFRGIKDREDGPAYIDRWGLRKWYKGGKLYRANDLPTEEHVDGTKIWHDKKGNIHRTTGPAIIDGNGGEMWYINGIRLDPEEFQRRYGPNSSKPSQTSGPLIAEDKFSAKLW